MSKLKELIDRLCPNGVEYKPLGEVGTFIRGNGLQKKDFVDEGVGCIHYGQIYTYYGTYTTETKSFVPESLAKKLVQVNHGNLIIACTSENVEDVGKAVAWLGEDDIVTGGHSVVYRHSLNPKFVAYFFQTENFFFQKKKYSFGAKVIDIKASDLAKIIIPIPPIEVQEEIVKILDSFSDYAAELQAELQARKEQYEYYRNLLLTFNPSACGCGTDDKQENSITSWGGHSYEITWKTMGEICDIKGRIGFRGYTRKDIVSKGHGAISLSPSNIINGSLFIDNSTYISWDKYNESPEIMVENGDVIFAKTASVGKTAIIRNLNEKATINPQLVVLKRIKCNPLYLSFLLNSSYFQTEVKKITGVGSVPNVPQSSLAKIRIPIPPLEIQDKIAAILDRFETLVNDLTQGLPAEISAIKEQYEYYRNKLLTFKRRDMPSAC